MTFDDKGVTDSGIADLGQAGPDRDADPAGSQERIAAIRDRFPNDLIPENRFDPIGAGLVNLWPLPQRAGVANNFDTLAARETRPSTRSACARAFASSPSKAAAASRMRAASIRVTSSDGLRSGRSVGQCTA